MMLSYDSLDQNDKFNDLKVLSSRNSKLFKQCYNRLICNLNSHNNTIIDTNVHKGK